jgi:serine-type D-Ala-D-Ala carboxypeptidase (penicillin-binding protein 5/6)
MLETHGSQTPTPTASTAKLITALAVLHAKPLMPGRSGPTITISANDVAIYNAYVAQDGSAVRVQAGEQLSEYQMLEGMLLPSADNLADSLAIWAFGSLPAYSNFANIYVRQLGLTATHVGNDASGLNPSTTSTAQDLVRLGELTMRNPALAQIVGQSTANGIPVVGTIKNVNWLLGTNGIIGVKTGNTDQAGGVFVSASRVAVNGKPVTIITALAGMPTLRQAMDSSLPLIQSAQANFRRATVIRTGSVVGHYRLPWGGTVSAKAARQLTVKTWSGGSLTAIVGLNAITANSRAGQTVGSLTIPKSAIVNQRAVPVTLAAAPARPTIWWRLLHPF